MIQTRQLIPKIASMLQQTGLSLFDFSIFSRKGKIHVQVIVDKLSGPVSIEDCEKASRLIGPLVEEENIPGPYFLEVSSPGLERPLRGPDDYKRFCGQSVKVKVKQPVEKRGVFIGKLLRFDEEQQRLEILERDAKREFSIGINNIKDIHLYLEV
ncbi:MAG TPA: ribosome maturation factor RimP [Thermotogota bacterium]|nr:ribosome maturation factor RimP [Thermotogota bacterium]HRW91879.1 ribosome maturation factor RimP [Thermotogota bacterium]